MGFREGTYLFRDRELDQYLGKRRSAMLAEVERLPAQIVMTGQLDELASALAVDHRCQPAGLRREDLYLRTEELAMSADEVSDGRLMFDLDEGQTIPGTRYSWHVPFEGDRELLFCSASAWSANLPQADVGNGELVFARRAHHQHDAAQLKADFERACNQTEQCLRDITARVERFNQKLVTRPAPPSTPVTSHAPRQ
jgi:hypothetical protein